MEEEEVQRLNTGPTLPCPLQHSSWVQAVTRSLEGYPPSRARDLTPLNPLHTSHDSTIPQVVQEGAASTADIGIPPTSSLSTTYPRLPVLYKVFVLDCNSIYIHIYTNNGPSSHVQCYIFSIYVSSPTPVLPYSLCLSFW